MIAVVCFFGRTLVFSSDFFVSSLLQQVKTFVVFLFQLLIRTMGKLLGIGMSNLLFMYAD